MLYVDKFKDAGSIISSSDQFGAKMFEVASRHCSRYARGVFVGTGSGVVAQYFMHTPIPFVFVEKHPDFVREFHRQFGADKPLLAEDFFNLPLDVSDYGLANCLVVSCMPVTGPFFSPALVERFRAVLATGSTIVQMGYIPWARHVRLFAELQQAGVKVQRQATVLRNIPPASVFVLQQA